MGFVISDMDDIFDETGDDLTIARRDVHLTETSRFNDGFRDERYRPQPYRQIRPDGWQGGGWNHGGGHWNGGWRGRHAHGDNFGYQQPHCVVRKVRYWDGWGWVVDRRRVCN